MRTEEEIRSAASDISGLMSCLEYWEKEGHTESEINYMLEKECNNAGSEILSAEFIRGLYRNLSWVLGVGHGADLDEELRDL